MDVKIATRSVVEGEVVVLEEAAQAAGPVLEKIYLLEWLVILSHNKMAETVEVLEEAVGLVVEAARVTGTADTSVRAMEDVRSPTLDHPGQVSCLDPVFLNPLEDPALEPHESARTATGLLTASVHEKCYFHSFDIHWIRIKKE